MDEMYRLEAALRCFSWMLLWVVVGWGVGWGCREAPNAALSHKIGHGHMLQLTIAIDGPAGAGKSTAAKALAKALGLSLVDTGALYRGVALQAQRAGVAWDAASEASLAAIAQSLDARFDFDGESNRIFLSGEDTSTAIRSPEIAQGASKIAALPMVRSGLMELQRTIASQPPGAVLEGRDIGTVVLPNASAKFFLTAPVETRVKRRHAELVAAGGEPPEYETLLAMTAERDRRDSERAVAPLKQADDAVLIDSSSLTVDAIVQTMISEVHRRNADT